MKKVCVIGLGYIGLPTALLLSNHYEVYGFDINVETVEKINRKEPTFTEPGLLKLLIESNITASTVPVIADIYIVCVPTPYDRDVKMADLNYVKKAIESINPLIKPGDLIIIESTVTPGTCETVILPLLERTNLKVGTDVFLSHCPERAIPGNSLYEMTNNDRLIGGINEESTELATEVYRSFTKGSIYKTDSTTAEFVKLIENTYRDVNIALANELAFLSEDMGVNVWKAIELANRHPRVNIHWPGPGVGGHCLAVDPWFLTESSCDSKMIALARRINDDMPAHVVNLVKKFFKGRNLVNPTVTVLGVSYKADVDDTRETPAIKLIRLLEKEGYRVKIYDPIVKKFCYKLCSFDESINGTDMIILQVNHSEFKKLEPARLELLVKTRAILDTRNIIDKKKFLEHNFSVMLLGDGSQ
jgi:UDP-N-acetyl-D-mannosaminuronic acid dehydrogenase